MWHTLAQLKKPQKWVASPLLSPSLPGLDAHLFLLFSDCPLPHPHWPLYLNAILRRAYWTTESVTRKTPIARIRSSRPGPRVNISLLCKNLDVRVFPSVRGRQR